MPAGGTRRERTVAGVDHANRTEKLTNKLGDLMHWHETSPNQAALSRLPRHRQPVGQGTRGRALLSARLITACEAEADFAGQGCGVRGE